MGFARKLSRLRQRNNPLRFLAGRILARTGLCRLCVIKTHGYLLRFYPTTLSEEIWYNPADRASDVQFLRSFLKPGDVYIDVGANIGTTVIPAAEAVGSTGRVLAFEPHPRIFRFLGENVKLNGKSNITAHNVALGESTHEASISDLPDDDRNCLLSPGNSVRIQVRTLDNFTNEFTSVNLLKVDAEGYEKFVFAGGAETLAKTEGLYVEMCEDSFQTFGYSVRELAQLLRNHGFKLYRINPNGSLGRLPVDYDGLSLHHENIVGIRNIQTFMGRTRMVVDE